MLKQISTLKTKKIFEMDKKIFLTERNVDFFSFFLFQKTNWNDKSYKLKKLKRKTRLQSKTSKKSMSFFQIYIKFCLENNKVQKKIMYNQRSERKEYSVLLFKHGILFLG